jgi:hypothetical protein
MSRTFALLAIAVAMSWIGVAEILASNLFLGINTLATVVICLLVSTEPLPPSVQSEGETPLASSDEISQLAAAGRAASQPFDEAA